MSDNHAENVNADDINPQEIIRRAMRELAAEVTQLRADRDLLMEGLAFLNKQSNGRFFVRQIAAPEEGTTLLESNLELETPPGTFVRKNLRVAVNAEGKIFTNLPNPNYVPKPFEPTQEQIDEINASVDNYGPPHGGPNDPSRQQKYDQSMERLKRAAEAMQANATATPAKPAATLTDLAKRAALNGRVSAMPDDTGTAATPAQRAVLDGLRQGLRQREVEMTTVEGMAKPLITGLEFLQDLSGGTLGISSGVIADGSSMMIEVKAITLESEYEEPFKTQFIKVGADGKVKLGTDRINYGPEEYDVLEKQDVEILKTLAKAAAFAGKIADTPARLGDDAGTEQKAVLEAVHQAQGEREMARVAAHYIEEGLRELQLAMGEDFSFEIKEPTDRGDVDLIINPWQPSKQEITVNGNGAVKIGKNEYNAFDPASLTAALTNITRNAMLQAPTAQAHNPRTQGPGF